MIMMFLCFCYLLRLASCRIVGVLALVCIANFCASFTAIAQQDTIIVNGRKQVSQPTGGLGDSLKSFKYMQMPNDDTLRIFIETRNEVARPEPYVTLLKISDGGAMVFSRQSLSQPEKIITAQLKPNEWKAIKQALDVKKFQAFKPESQIMVAIYRQSITVSKGTQRNTIRYQIDPSETDIAEIEQSIKEQLGTEGAPFWKLIQPLRAVNARFRW